MIRAALLAVAIGAMPLAALADAGPPPRTPVAGAPDPAALAAARDLMRETDLQAQMRSVAPRMAEAAGAQMRQTFADNKIPEGLQSQIAQAAQAFVGSMDALFTPALIDQMATIYARHFSVADLRRLTEIMRDPAMLRFRQEMPNTMAEMMPLIMAAMQPRQRAFQAQILQITTDWFKQHPEDKAKLRSPTAN